MFYSFISFLKDYPRCQRFCFKYITAAVVAHFLYLYNKDCFATFN